MSPPDGGQQGGGDRSSPRTPVVLEPGQLEDGIRSIARQVQRDGRPWVARLFDLELEIRPRRRRGPRP